MKQLSVIIPMYNVEQYLEKCIDSVYNQGLKEEEFEVILVDDESPDNSLAVATILTKDKKNVTIISQKNKGLGGARNTGILCAAGRYVLFLDSDDWYLPNVAKNPLDESQKKEFENIWLDLSLKTLTNMQSTKLTLKLTGMLAAGLIAIASFGSCNDSETKTSEPMFRCSKNQGRGADAPEHGARLVKSI